MAYYDELEIWYPLGAAAKTHKVGVIFMFLANIRPSFRSTLRPTQLVAVARSRDIKQHGIDAILKPFVADLNTLSTEGINVSVKGVNRVYKGAMLAFLTDNLASHSVGGFKESMSFAFRFCRSCMATRAKSQKEFLSCKFHLRNSREHAMQCQQLTGSLEEHYSTIYGINCRSILEDVMHFSVATCLPHDIMHDLLEGTLQYEIKALLKNCIKDMKYFTLEQLNVRISSFDYGYAESSNKPFQIEQGASREDFRFRQTASSMWLLSRTMSLLIGDKVSQGDPAWYCFQLLLKILDICTMQSCCKDTVAYLSTLIEEHHSLFLTTYQIPLIPKMHYIIHYPEQILRFGPLINSWNMRHEAKLNLCKQVGKFGNFKNICLSIAMKHQRWMCLQLQSPFFLQFPPECGGKSEVRQLYEEP